MQSCGTPSGLGCPKRPSSSPSGGFLTCLIQTRERLADYQEQFGVPRTEQYSFVMMVTSLCQHAYKAFVTIFTMLYHLTPLLEGFVYLGRFVLDKLIDICRADGAEKVFKLLVFICEISIIMLMVMAICGFILFPVWYLLKHILGKIITLLMSTGG